jgi:hypothetical protein
VYTGQLETRTNLNKLEKESISQHFTITRDLSDMMILQKNAEKKNLDFHKYFDSLMNTFKNSQETMLNSMYAFKKSQETMENSMHAFRKS